MNHPLLLVLVVFCLTRAAAGAVEIIAHRGASYDAPENSVAAFRLGWQQQADANELDIHMTKDGQIVVIHDKTTKRTTGIDKPVVEQTLDELRGQDAGSWKGRQWASERIPTLAEALATMPDGKRTFIEIKCGSEALSELKRVLTASGKKPEQLVIIGFGYDTMAAAKKRFPHVQVYWVVDYKGAAKGDEPPTVDELIQKATQAGLDGLDLNHRFPLDAATVAAIKQRKLKLFVWTVNHAAVAARLAAAGVDGITTDRPQWIREQLAQAEATGRVDDPWKKHVVFSGGRNMTVVGAEFAGDRKVDVISTFGGAAHLFTAPDWKQTRIYEAPTRNFTAIHSEVMDCDDDGDVDYIAAIPTKGVFWLENPGSAAAAWTYHNIDDEIHGIHCTLRADVDGNGKLDLLVNNFENHGAAPNSLTWLKRPENPRASKSWMRHVLAKGDAPGGSHYFGFGDVDGDGRNDVCIGAKGTPFQGGNWFAWWKRPENATHAWQKQIIAENQIGATNIHPADLNGDGKVDFFASRGHGRGIVWFEGPTWKPHEVDATLDGPHCLQVHDIDGDGDLDAATCAKIDKLAVWYENDGRGSFMPRVVGKDQSAYDIRILDMDGDGDVDFLIAGELSANIVWYENPLR